MFFKGLRKNAMPSGEEGRKIRERFKDDGACHRCGVCCHQGFVVCGYFVLIPELPCKHLVYSGNGKYYCEAYERRKQLGWCNPCNEKTVKQGLFPPDCAYVQGLINYEGKTLPPAKEMERVKKALRRRMRYMPRPDYLRASDWAKFIKKLNEK